MNLAEYYYEYTFGYIPNDADLQKNVLMIEYLKQASVSDEEILRIIEENTIKAPFITPEILPDWLWENSLLKRNAFYYHNQLRIQTPRPTYNPFSGKEKAEKFYLEMKIRFTIKDLLDYYYKNLRIDKTLADEKRDVGAFEYLLNNYQKIRIVESVDFVLSLIDAAKIDGANSLFGVLDLKNYEAEVYETTKQKVNEARAAGVNKVVWRWQ